MSRSDYLKSITLKRESRTGDGAGGKVVSLSTVSTFSATKHFYRKESLTREEVPKGVEVEEMRLFVVRNKPFPAVELNDRLVLGDGTEFLVIHPARVYSETMQIDTRIMR
jgi:hypothetical protein